MLKNYLLNTGGNVATMFAVSATALLICIGAAVDYSGAVKQSTQLQGYADAAVLAAAASGEKDINKLKEIAKSSLVFHNTDNIPMDATIFVNSEDVRIEAIGRYDTVFMGVVGKNSFPVRVEAASPLKQDTNVNLALVLDTTGSMAGANMSALIDASEDLIEALEDSGNDIRVSMVPFAQYVNVGMNNKGASWLDVSKDGTVDTNEVCWTHVEWEEAPTCTGTGREITTPIYQDGVHIRDHTYEEQTCTDGVKSLEEQRCEMRDTTFTWYGCVDSRIAPFNEKAEFGVTRIPGNYNNSSLCGAPMIPLTDNLESIESAIENLEAKGETYLPAGLMWGWRSLNKNEPFRDTKPREQGTINAMLFMTDGGNTKSAYTTGEHFGSDKAAGLALSEKLCDHIKNDDIQIFTVAYNMPGGTEDTKAVLKSCASSPSQVFDPKNPGQLKAAFKQVANSLDYTRLKY